MQLQVSAGRRAGEMKVAAVPPVGSRRDLLPGQPDMTRKPRAPTRRHNKPLKAAA